MIKIVTLLLASWRGKDIFADAAEKRLFPSGAPVPGMSAIYPWYQPPGRRFAREWSPQDGDAVMMTPFISIIIMAMPTSLSKCPLYKYRGRYTSSMHHSATGKCEDYTLWNFACRERRQHVDSDFAYQLVDSTAWPRVSLSSYSFTSALLSLLCRWRPLSREGGDRNQHALLVIWRRLRLNEMSAASRRPYFMSSPQQNKHFALSTLSNTFAIYKENILLFYDNALKYRYHYWPRSMPMMISSTEASPSWQSLYLLSARYFYRNSMMSGE